MFRIVVVLVSLFTCTLVYARMYQWVDPENGTTQLSGKPPVWYRNAAGGPRVFVFENGKIVDDTGIKVSDTERDRLRQQAFLMAEQDREKARAKLLEAKRMQALLDREKQAEPEKQDIAENLELDSDDEIQPQADQPESEEETIEEMRNLIQEWERRRTENARGLINRD